ncbi:acyl carrier protein [Streptomyces kronopolitis]|uniref:Acyl carrier protein n=1 Tax=Streptomyces kronopolitis TaxID=1612435 RepID=A0ABQ2JV04_9ACTN|nr:phosphopantetheine-binding protein [Streptomyces kronopolitis]GGN56501.1 acyl carrier protein [Streptomyces kronopolitis]
MDRQHMVGTIQSALSGVLEREVPEVSEETRFFDDLHLDSTSILELLMALEEEVGFTVDPEEVDMDDFVSVATFINYLERLETT